MAKTSRNHDLLLSGNNPEMLTTFREGLKIEVRQFEPISLDATCICNKIYFKLFLDIDIT